MLCSLESATVKQGDDGICDDYIGIEITRTVRISLPSSVSGEESIMVSFFLD